MSGSKKVGENGSLIGQKYLDVDLVSLVKNKIHVLVEANDNALKSDVDNVVKPNLNFRKRPETQRNAYLDAELLLKEAEQQVDGLNHDLLDLMARHFGRSKFI